MKAAVGEMLEARPNLLPAAWKFAVMETVDEGAGIEFEIRPVSQSCPMCGTRPRASQAILLQHCPACNRMLRINSGREVFLLRVDFEPGPVRADEKAGAS